MISSLISRAVAIPAAILRRQQPPVPQPPARPEVEHWRREAERFARAAAPATVTVPAQLPPLEYRSEEWPGQLHEELETLGDLTEKRNDSWQAACEMDWSR